MFSVVARILTAKCTTWTTRCWRLWITLRVIQKFTAATRCVHISSDHRRRRPARNAGRTFSRASRLHCSTRKQSAPTTHTVQNHINLSESAFFRLIVMRLLEEATLRIVYGTVQILVTHFFLKFRPNMHDLVYRPGALWTTSSKTSNQSPGS